MNGMSISEITNMVISAYDSIANMYTEAYSENDDLDSGYMDYFIDRLIGKRVLDMGCGNGINTNYLNQRGLDVFGIDASEKMLLEARRLFPYLRFECKDILATNFADSFFDGIVLAYVLNHFNMAGLEILKKEINRILKSNGFIFISVHEGSREEIVSDPLDSSINIYYNFLSLNVIDEIFSGYKREYFKKRVSYGEDEFLCDKMFIVYRKVT